MTLLPQATDPLAELGAGVLTGPLAALAVIVWGGYLIVREIRKLREADVAELTEKVGQLEDKVDAANRQISDIKEQHMNRENTTLSRLVRAREMLVERGVEVGELP